MQNTHYNIDTFYLDNDHMYSVQRIQTPPEIRCTTFTYMYYVPLNIVVLCGGIQVFFKSHFFFLLFGFNNYIKGLFTLPSPFDAYDFIIRLSHIKRRILSRFWWQSVHVGMNGSCTFSLFHSVIIINFN